MSPAPTQDPGAGPHGIPVLRLGFRPFYLGAALLAAAGVPVWTESFLGRIAFAPALPALYWHAHEMLFGFVCAVICGFLLTASRVWTGLQTPRGLRLGLLFGLWLAARITGITGPYAVFALLDFALLPWVAAILAQLLLRARSWRNLPLAAILLLLACANLVFHLALLGRIALPPLRAVHAGLALVIMIEAVIAGRVIPAFSTGAIAGLKLPANAALERGILLLTGLALASWVLLPAGSASAALLALAAAAHALRQIRWRPLATRGRPILWILHAAYAFIPLGLALLAAAAAGAVAASIAVHALMVGATGGLIIGMITRTARGHTGRPLQAGRAEVLAYLLVLLAAVLRVLPPLFAPGALLWSVQAAALAWSAAFLIYLAVYTPWLLATRLDGRDG